MEAVLTGDPIDVDTAHRGGLVNQLCDAGQALETALALAGRISANAPVAVRASRQVVLEAVLADEATGWRLSEEAMGKAMRSADFSEGLTAFIDKRPPEWTGR